jgi:uncharacterized alpha/beta hydrolase family protein
MLFFEALVLDFLFRMMIITFPLKYYSFLLGNQSEQSSDSEDLQIDDKVKSVLRASKRAFRESLWESVCFDKALTVKNMLSRRGVKTTIYFGLQKDEKKMLKAHAWLRYGKYIITGRAGMDKFKVVSYFS